MSALPLLHPHDTIADVALTNLRAFRDDRGQFVETFRASWFPQADWSRIQTNRSDSAQGVLRGLHYHFHQVDYWVVTRGTIRVGLADLRPGSPSYLTSAVIDIDAENPRGLFVPVGVAHGFYAVTDCTLTYLVNNYYDSSDEHGVAWDDPDLAVPWGVPSAVLSPRDMTNRPWREIPTDVRPR